LHHLSGSQYSRGGTAGAYRKIAAGFADNEEARLALTLQESTAD